MLALTQCWFTRVHVPQRRPVAAGNGSHTATCRHCARRIVSWAKGSWHIADGFNVAQLAESSAARFLYIVDARQDFIVARFPVSHLADEDAVRAYATDLKQAHGIDEPDAGLSLRDSYTAG